MPKKKELHYFDRDENFRTKPNYGVYHYKFVGCTTGQLLGEVTPDYIYWRDALPRMWQYNPDLKIIVLLRDPISRAYSHWNMQRSRGADTRPFLTAVQEEDETCRTFRPKQCKKFSYVKRSMYSGQLTRMWEFFSPDQTLILKSDDLLSDPHTTLSRVASFLEIGPFPVVKPITHVTHTYESKMTEEDRAYLRSIFTNDVREVERLLGWDCSDWLS
jgi:hypothetical protein